MDKRCKITKAESTYIEILYYEYTTRKDIISSLLQIDRDISTDRFKDFFSKYQESYIAYDCATKDIVKRYSSGIADPVQRWSINFDDCEIIFTLGGCSECASEKK